MQLKFTFSDAILATVSSFAVAGAMKKFGQSSTAMYAGAFAAGFVVLAIRDAIDDIKNE